jgi:nucleotide-binding universal stress UspA family protein
VNGAIICGVDDSDSAKGAARVARALGSELGRRVIFVRAVGREPTAADVAAMTERLASLSASVNGDDCGAAWSVEIGHPVDALVAAAKKARAAMIVVGSTGPRSSLLGSVSSDISRRAPCPVIVVPPGADATVGGRANDNGANTPRYHEGGIGIGAGGIDYAGGIARFSLASAEKEP